MTRDSVAPKINAQILEEATSWFIDFKEGEVDAQRRETFSGWLRTSPQHVRAYLQVSAFWEDVDLMNKARKLDMDVLVQQALAESNVLSLELPARSASATTPAAATLPHRRPRTRRFAIAASVLGVVAAAGAVAWFQAYRTPTYTTQVGEQRSITLDDGSTVELNSRSRLRVHFTDRERAIELLEGQALFRVAKNAARPFVVSVDEARVRAVGTQFDVYRRSGGTVVTVVEGRVAVSSAAESESVRDHQHTGTADVRPAGMNASRVLLSAGEQVTVRERAIAPARQIDVGAATAWTQKKIVFDDAPLSEVVAEFNRYNRRAVIIDDPELAAYHITGAFPSTDSERLIELLKQRFDVVVDETPDEIRVFRP